jgi:hypothetical protein
MFLDVHVSDVHFSKLHTHLFILFLVAIVLFDFPCYLF